MLRVASIADRRSSPTWSTPGSPWRKRRNAASSLTTSPNPGAAWPSWLSMWALPAPGASGRGAGTVVVTALSVGAGGARSRVRAVAAIGLIDRNSGPRNRGRNGEQELVPSGRLQGACRPLRVQAQRTATNTKGARREPRWWSSGRAVQADDADSDVLQPTAVEIAAQLIGLDGCRQPVERSMCINLPGLGINSEDDIAVALSKLLRCSDQRRFVGCRVLRHRITS